MKMFLRQMTALIRKNFLIKKRNWKNTIWEVLLPLFCGLLAGAYTVDTAESSKTDDPIQLFSQIATMFMVSFVLISVSFSGTSAFILNQVVVDKETKMKESLKIMSLGRVPYSLSYFVSQAAFVFFTASILTLAFIFTYTNPIYQSPRNWHLFFSILLFGLALMSVSLFLTTVFTDSKLSAQVGLYILLFPTSIFLYSVSYRLNAEADSPFTFDGNPWFQLWYFIPNFSFGVVLIDYYIHDGAKFILGLNVSVAWVSLLLSIPFYFCLYMWVDAIMPNTFGIKESFCFCLNKKKTQVEWGEFGENNPEEDLTRFVGAGLDGSRDQAPIKMRNLTKKFGKFVAVDKLNLEVSSNEVLCLLGHNGAGKTTAINMLTGMIQATEGSCTVFGRDLITELASVRQNMGLCQQFDVLFDSLSIFDHLKLVCDIKCLPTNQIQAEIDDTLRVTMLTEHQQKLVRELSGGMKRKLSLGMSLVGQSRLIILDEPTSGLDVDSRRQIWEIIKKLKATRSIILSTQHIEEADVLANRVCIMSHGKVIALDTPSGIKRQYGVGYTLIIEFVLQTTEDIRDSRHKTVIDEIVLQSPFISNASVSQDLTGSKKLVYLIPFTETYKFSNVLQQLEEFQDLLVSVELTSLEDAYLSICKNEKTNQLSSLGDLESPLAKRQEHEQAIAEYQATIGIQENEMQQLWAMTTRRLIVFTREPRQWFLTISPFINVVTFFLIFYSMFELTSDGQMTKDVADLVQLLVALMFPMILNVGYATTSGVYLLMPIEERQRKMRHILSMTGMRVVPYWLGLFIADYILFLMPTALFTLFVLCIQLSGFEQHLAEFICVMLGFGLGIISLTYLIAHFFETQDEAIKWNIFVQLIFGTVIPMIVMVVLGGISQSGAVLKFTVTFFYMINPMFTFYLANLQIVVDYLIELATNVKKIEIPLAFGFEANFTLSLSMFLLQFVLYMGVVMVLDWHKTNEFRKKAPCRTKIEQPQMEVNEDVKDHATQVLETPDWQIKATDLHKTYASNGLHAVCGNTFGVKQGSIMGLLGPNGAGKSSTFSVLAMELARTSGEAYLLNESVEKISLEKKGKLFGMCPQYNTIWEQLTVEENLQMIARIKGLSHKQFMHNKNLIIQTLDLEEFEKIRASNLSGGNKRKLACALTLMISPTIEFLDEPTTGVDPVSRRSLFSMIKQLKDASILLTTHRMDEAEQLCDQIAIMINGRIVCYGSPNYLMKTYGGGYEVTITVDVKKSSRKEVRRMMELYLPGQYRLQFQGSSVQNTQMWLMNYKLSPTLPLSDIFESIQKIVEAGHAEFFEATRTSLEQVFIAFARFQHNAGGTVDAEAVNTLEPKVIPVNQSSIISSSLRDTVSEDQSQRFSMPSFGMVDNPRRQSERSDRLILE